MTPSFVRAAHYFGDQWPVNFWNSFDRDRVPHDMAQIRNDGFNAVILVVPWYPFSPAGDPEIRSFYSAGMKHVMRAAQDAGLDIILRVGYPHDTLDDASRKAKTLCAAIVMRDPDATAWWKASLMQVQDIAASFDRYIYAFFSWEDIWCAIREFPEYGEEERRAAARRTGFQAYAFDRLGGELVSYLSGRQVDSADEIAVPVRRSPLFLVYKEFVEDFLGNTLLPAGREAIPELGFEARLDKEPVDGLQGTIYWASYNLFLNRGLRASYWAPFMGQQNVGETLTAESAAASLRRVLGRVTRNGQRPDHLLEQFNFIDNTPKFPQAARIDDSEIPAFLAAAAPLLRDQSAGYGIWTYRDYRHNYLANAAFNMGFAAFEVTGGVELVAASGSGQRLHVSGTGTLSQQVAFQATLDQMRGFYDPLSFCLSARSAAPAPFCVRIFLNDNPAGRIDGTASPERSTFCQELALEYAGPERSARLRIEFDARGVEFDGIALFNHVQKGGIYNVDGSPGSLLGDIRELNRRLGR